MKKKKKEIRKKNKTLTLSRDGIKKENLLVLLVFAIVILSGVFYSFFYGVIFLSPQGLTDCGILNQANTVYELQNDVSSGGTCFAIEADNITLDGKGFNITGDGDVGDNGIYSTRRNNLTIKNLTIYNFSSGIYFSETNNSLIEDVATNENSLYGILLSTSSDNNVLSSITANNNSNHGIFLLSSSNNDLSSIIANENSLYGIILSTSSDNNVLSSITANDNDYGIRLIASSNNSFKNSLLDGSEQDAIFIALSSNDNILKNITITNTNYSFYDIKWNNAEINNTHLIDMPHIGNYSFAGAGGTIIVKNSEFGEIKFLEPVNGSGNNLTKDIRIENRKFSVNSTSNSGFNRSAELYFYADFVSPALLRGGENCGNCVLLNNENGIAAFGVPGFTTYEVIETYSPPPPNEGNGGNGGSSGGYWRKTFSEDDEDIKEKEEIIKSLKERERIKLKINGETHYIGLRDIGNGKVEIEVRSVSQIADLTIEEIKNFDVNNDGIYDISVKLDSITGSSANLILTSYVAEPVGNIPPDASQPYQLPQESEEQRTDETPQIEQEAGKNTKFIVGLVLVFIILILIVISLILIVLIIRDKRRNKLNIKNKQKEQTIFYNSE